MCGSLNYTFSVLFLGDVHDRKRTCGSKNRVLSPLFRGKQYARGRKKCCFVGEDMREGKRVRLKESHILSPILLERVREEEKVRFEEPHVLRAVSSPLIWDRQREMCGSKNRTFLFPVFWKKVWERERMCASSSRTFSLLSCEKKYLTGRENMWLEDPHVSLSRFVGDGTREEKNVRFFEPHILSSLVGNYMPQVQRMYGSKNRTFSLLFC